MNTQQELEQAVKELEMAKAGLKNPGVDAKKRDKLESKMHWLEQKVDRLTRKSQN